jgi:6-phosphogluconolactonase
VVRPLVNRFKDAHVVAEQVAFDLFAFVSSALQTQERVDIAVTGGTVGIAALAAAKTLPFNTLDLSRLHIWWGDERFVDSTSSDRNALQARNAWLKDLKIAESNIHEFPASDSGLSLDSAAIYFGDHFLDQGVSFDLMLMGMGPDGHIASLFPGKTAGEGYASVIAEHDSPKPPPQRLSFSYDTINQSRQIWFTVAGSDKAEAVAKAFGEEPTVIPAGRIQGKEKTVWYVDQTAGNLVWGC